MADVVLYIIQYAQQQYTALHAMIHTAMGKPIRWRRSLPYYTQMHVRVQYTYTYNPTGAPLTVYNNNNKRDAEIYYTYILQMNGL